MLLAGLFVNAQSNDFDKDLKTFLSINGSTETYSMVYDQITMQLKTMNPNVPDSAWVKLKTEVFNPEVDKLIEQIIPLYKKHFTHEDIKALISFYESPIGKKLVSKTPQLTQESMKMGQSWGIGLMSKFNDWIKNNGYN